MSADDADGPDELEEPAAPSKLPKLTIGQRILTALPNLDRQGPAPAPSPQRRSTGRPNGVSTSRASAAGRGARDPQAETKGGEDADEEPIEPDEVIARPARATSSQRRPTTGAGGGAGANRADAMAHMSNQELTQAIKRIDERERMYAMVSGVVGAVSGIALTILALHANPAVGHKNHVAPSTIWFEGAARVVFGGAAFGVSFTRRRSLVAFSLLFLGLTVFPVGIIFMGLGLWMLFRVTRYQNVLKQRGVSVQRSRTSQSRPRAAATRGSVDARERVRARREARDIRRGRQVVPAGPPASKRYTPKKPTRPRPPAPTE